MLGLGRASRRRRDLGAIDWDNVLEVARVWLGIDEEGPKGSGGSSATLGGHTSGCRTCQQERPCSRNNVL